MPPTELTALSPQQGADAIASLLFPSGTPKKEETPAAETAAGDEPELELEDTPADESADDAPPADAEPVDDETPAPRKFKVKANGEDLEVDEPELIAGYSRTADYTKKTQALADDRKKVATELEAVSAERKQYAEYLPQLRKAMETAQGAEPDWEKVKAEQPAAYPALYADWQRNQEAITAVKAEEKRAQEAVATDEVTKFRAKMVDEHKALIKAIPAWEKPDVAKKESDEMRAYALKQGFDENTINSISDHRALILLRKSMLYDRALARSAALRTTPGEARTIRPGSARPVEAPRRANTALKRLQQTGDVKDAAAAIAERVFGGQPN